ncbi:hypothetical protein NMG60_11035023 [Bertholletia excelsa]
MGCPAASATAAATAVGRLPLTCAHKRTIKGCGLSLRAKFNGDTDESLFQAAIDRAALRFQETRRPDPLFIDQYAGCFIRESVQMDLEHYTHRYCLAIKFIDYELLTKLKNIDGLKQVVLFTDGMDTRPYRLSWPTSTLIFDVSPETIFRASAQMLQDVGAKIQKGCLFLHIPLESSDIQQTLCSKGFNGNQTSTWVLQGLPLTNLASLEKILSIISSLAMKGCLFLENCLPVLQKLRLDRRQVSRCGWISFS